MEARWWLETTWRGARRKCVMRKLATWIFLRLIEVLIFEVGAGSAMFASSCAGCRNE